MWIRHIPLKVFVIYELEGLTKVILGELCKETVYTGMRLKQRKKINTFPLKHLIYKEGLNQK